MAAGDAAPAGSSSSSHLKAAATAGPATKVQSANFEYAYPHGHLGHLTAEEEQAFRNFKLHLAEHALYRPGPPASHDDTTLLRFLRARRWNIHDAYSQFKDTEQWRAAIHIDTLYDTIDVDAYEESRKLYPQWTGRRDKRGIPLYVFEIRHLDSKAIAAYEKSLGSTYSKAASDGKTPSKLIRLFALYENLTRFAQPLCTQLTDRDFPRTPITLSTNIVDVSGVGLKQFWNLKAHMQAASQLATAHYPETLDRIFIIGAPSFFSTVWGWIKRWFDPVTVSKIFILSPHEVFPVLSSFIDPANIPRQYGGQLDFKWCDTPELDPKIRQLATWENGYSNFPKGPLYWVPVDGGKRLACMAKGSVGQKERSERVCTIPKAFADEQQEVLATANGTAVEAEPRAEAAPVTTEEGKLEEARGADIPEAKATTKEVDASTTGPVVTNGLQETCVSPVESPTDADFRSAYSTPPTTAGLPDVQNLSMDDYDEKKAMGEDATMSEKMAEAEDAPTKKPVVAS